MIIKILCLVLVLAITWVWLNRGFFNAFIQMLCTIAAGAIAFAFWEPLAYLMLSFAPEKGFLTLIAYIAWGAGLLVPFGGSLLILRFATDALLKTKVNPAKVVDYAGGAICGGVSAMITVGMFFIAFGFLPGSYSVRPIDYSPDQAAGTLRRAGGLWIPAEKFTAALYGQMSTTSLSTGTPLADYYPDLDLAGYAVNISIAEGKARPSVPPEAVRVVKTYFVGNEAGNSPMRDLLVSGVGPDSFVQQYIDINGESVTSGRVFGAVIEFGEQAKEQNGQVIMGNGQARLLMRGPDGMKTAHPIALITQASASNPDQFGRYPFDGEEVFIASVGGASKSTMGLEFVVPQGYTPEAVIVKNTRVMLDATEQSFPDALSRFAALNSGALVGGSSVGELDLENRSTVAIDPQAGFGAFKTIIVGSALGYTFEVRQKGGLTLNEDNEILRGTQKFAPGDLDARGLNRNVMVDKFAESSDIKIVKVNVSRESPASLLGPAGRVASRVLPPQLIDANNQAYQAVGYIYEDNSIVEISFDPASSIRGMQQVPTISSSRSDQELWLVFRVSKGVDLRYFSIGSKVISEFDPIVVVE